jgi:hypothetical protein
MAKIDKDNVSVQTDSEDDGVPVEDVWVFEKEDTTDDEHGQIEQISDIDSEDKSSDTDDSETESASEPDPEPGLLIVSCTQKRPRALNSALSRIRKTIRSQVPPDENSHLDDQFESLAESILDLARKQENNERLAVIRTIGTSCMRSVNAQLSAALFETSELLADT